MSVISEIINEFKYNMEFRRRLMPAQKEINEKAPKEGDIAPDFTLFDVEGKNSVTLSDFQGEIPVALVFGSFT